MGSPLNLSIIAPCTGRKAWSGPSMDAFRHDAASGSSGASGAPCLTLHIVSAGMGVVEERERIPPYEATFTALRGRARREWAQTLGIPAKIAAVVARPADLRLVLLGREYLEVAALPPITDGTPTIVLAAPSAADLVPAGALHVPLSQAHARRFHATLIALKGELVRRLLCDAALWRRPDVRRLPAWRDADAFLDLCQACGAGAASGEGR